MRNNTPAPLQDAILFVDLDGTLIKTDLFQEAILLALKFSPVTLWRALLKLGQGRAVAKRLLAQSFVPEADYLPPRPEVVEFLSQQREEGRQIVLATASDSLWANPVAKTSGLFDDVLASQGGQNLKGPAKLAAIQEYCRQKGCSQFDYIGDSSADLPIWQQARHAYLAAPSRALLKTLAQFRQPTALLGQRESLLQPLIKSIRPEQWLKNLLIFTPILLSHKILNLPQLTLALIAFLVFCGTASGIYILNGLMDIEPDRQHPTKRNRPFASGSLPLWLGPPLALALIAISVAAALFWLPLPFTGLVLLYVFINVNYSTWLKRVVLADVLTLASLYTLRIFAGGAATGIAVSEWLNAFSGFLFVSLAFAKRYSELSRLALEKKETTPGRGYMVRDLGIVESVGPATGCIAVLVFALYINSAQVQSLYNEKWALWLICPLFLYWICRIWIVAIRGQLNEDPLLFAAQDPVGRAVGLIVLGLVLIAWLG